jgi:hypothetical protein
MPATMNNLDRPAFGRGLNTAQRLAVKGSLRQLQLNENFQECGLWGIVLGQETDYIIAQAMNYGTSIEKVYYFSIDQGLSFSRIPELDEFITTEGGKIRGLFSGNPSRKCYPPRPRTEKNKNEEKREKFPEPDANDLLAQPAPERKGPAPRVLIELERLSYAVNMIERDTCLVPTGMFYLSAQGMIRENTDFAGIPLNAKVSTEHFLHFREPLLLQTQAARRRNANSNSFDFLDPVNTNQAATWKFSSGMQMNQSGVYVQARSMLWPGFEMQCSLGLDTRVGRIYVGYGEQNTNLTFMM